MTRKQIHVMTIGLLLANVMSGLDATIINTALPAIIADLHGISCMGLIVSGMSVSTLLWSKFGERMGNKKAFELAVVLFIVGSALEGLSPDILFFVCARLLMGIGAGGLGSIPYIIFGNVYENLHTLDYPRVRFGSLRCGFDYGTACRRIDRRFVQLALDLLYQCSDRVADYRDYSFFV